MAENHEDPDSTEKGLSRRHVLTVSGAGLLATAATAATSVSAGAATSRTSADPSTDGTPQQIHLTWGNDPARSVVVSRAAPGQATRPRVRLGERIIRAEQRSYTDGLNGETTYTYHAHIHGLRPGKTYAYTVTADNDANAADPFSATFTTAPEGRAKFRFTSFGDLATPNTAWVLSYGQYPGGSTSIAVTQYHALGADPVNPTTGAKGKPTGNYTVFETFTLVRRRADGGLDKG